MDNEALIHRQMEETRSALTQKLETLENKVTETVVQATNVVTDTVASVKEAVRETVDTVKGSVEGTVETVKDSFEGTVESVKETFDLPLQVERHPWLMVGGAVAAGYLTGRLFGGAGERAAEAYVAAGMSRASEQPHNGHVHSYRPVEESAPEPSPTHDKEPRQEGGGWLGAIEKQFAPEISKLKGLAIGTALGVVRDLVAQSFPEQFARPLTDIVDGINQKMGGEKIDVPIFGDGQVEPGETSGPHHGAFRQNRAVLDG